MWVPWCVADLRILIAESGKCGQDFDADWISAQLATMKNSADETLAKANSDEALAKLKVGVVTSLSKRNRAERIVVDRSDPNSSR
jgi:hypothetical protein